MTTIYVLCDPDTGEIRYVGKTTHTLSQRLRGHLTKAASGDKAYRNCWIRSLSKRPTIVGVDIVDDVDGASAEVAAIARYRAAGCRLVNLTDGGEGTPGVVRSPEYREKQRVSQSGKKLSAKTKEKICISSTGRSHSHDAREKIRAARIGMRQSSESIEKIRAAKLGVKRGPHTEETRAKIRAANAGMTQHPRSNRSGMKHSQESIARMRASHIGKTMPTEQRAKISAALSGRLISQETRARLRAAAIARYAPARSMRVNLLSGFTLSGAPRA